MTPCPTLQILWHPHCFSEARYGREKAGAAVVSSAAKNRLPPLRSRSPELPVSFEYQLSFASDAMPKDPTGEFASPAASAVAGGAAPAAATFPQTGFFGHPRGLATLFFTEFWERFSYYGMRALLILYMTAAVTEGGLGFDAARAGSIYGLYTAAVYLLALPGGWIADRLLGQRAAPRNDGSSRR